MPKYHVVLFHKKYMAKVDGLVRAIAEHFYGRFVKTEHPEKKWFDETESS